MDIQEWIPDVTPYLAYPDDPEYVRVATKNWIAMHESWRERCEQIQAEVLKQHLFKEK